MFILIFLFYSLNAIYRQQQLVVPMPRWHDEEGSCRYERQKLQMLGHLCKCRQSVTRTELNADADTVHQLDRRVPLPVHANIRMQW